MGDNNKIITYYNLSQCVGERLVYFRSTDVEQHNYHRLLWSVPDEWFYWLYKGYTIQVRDESSNNIGQIEKIFIPVLKDILEFVLEKQQPIHTNLKEHFQYAFNAILEDRLLRKRITFWRGKIPLPVKIIGTTIHVSKEHSIFEGI